MIREYAVDPKTLDNWANFRHFVDQCGVEHGRLISEFPKKWKRMVYEASAQCSDIERKRIEVRLQKMDGKLFNSGRSYDGKKDWLRNAEAQQAIQPFHAVVAKDNPRKAPFVVLASEVDEDTPLWKPERQRLIERTASSLVDVATPLLDISHEVYLVDPYFNPFDKKWLRTLKAIAAQAVSGKTKKVHLEVHSGNTVKAEAWMKECERALPRCVPAGTLVQVVRWQQRVSGPKPHARYILTEKGGLQVDYGLDDVSSSETTHVTLLDAAFHQTVLQQVQLASDYYKLVDVVKIAGDA